MSDIPGIPVTVKLTTGDPSLLYETGTVIAELANTVGINTRVTKGIVAIETSSNL